MGTRIQKEVIYHSDGSTETLEHVVQTTPLVLSKVEFRAFCSDSLAGGGLAGMARFQEIIDALKAGTGLIAYAFDEYDGASTFEITKSAQFLLLISSVLQAGELDAIINNWPEV